MAAFMKLAGIPGESTDQGHKDWVRIETMSAAITRSIPEGAKDQQRSRGNTTLGDVVVVRQLDKSSTKLQEACANGTFYTEVLIDFCTQVKNKQEPYLKYKLKNVIISSYQVNAHESGSPVPHESVTLAYSAVEWNYVVIDTKTGENKGNVPAQFDPGTGSGS